VTAIVNLFPLAQQKSDDVRFMRFAIDQASQHHSKEQFVDV